MDCNKEEALRAKDIAEKKMESRDFIGARKFALKAQQLYPDLENIAQMLVVCDLHCSAEQKLFGNEMDWYKILQLEQTASDATIKKQYRKFALQLHPDKNKFAGAEAAFKLIGEAQRVLLDREKRARYDMKCRVPMNKTAMPCHNQQKFPMNFNSAMKNNVRPNFTNSNAQQQQQYRQPVQQRQNGSRPTFWTACPFCSVKYQYYREVLNKSLRCHHCKRPFIAYNVDMQGTSSATNSSQQAFEQQKGGLNPGTFKVDVGSQGNLHAEKSNARSYEKKGPIDVSGKPGVKRKRNQVEESSRSSEFTPSSDSEGEDGFPGVENHSTCREEQPRRSTRQKRKVSYHENASDNDDDISRPFKRGQESGSPCGDGESPGAPKMNDQNGLASDRNEETKRVSGKEAPGRPKQMDETSEHSSPDSTFKATIHLNAYVYPDAEFSDFDRDRKKECFVAGQIWAIYDTTDGMPRFYGLIRKVLSPGFKLQITWLEPHPDVNDDINWVNEELPIACGKYKLGSTDITDDHLMFSHLVICEKISRNTFQVYPRKEETWALFKNWDVKWYMDAESHKQYEYEFVEILSDYVEGEGVCVAYLAKLKGFVSLFFHISKEDNRSFQITSLELLRFSHRVPSFKMTGQEGVGVHVGYFELDPASLPMNIEEVAVPEILDVNTKSERRSKPLMTPDRIESIPKVSFERRNLTENKDSLDDVDDCRVSPASTSEALEIPDTQFFNFDAGRSLDKFQIGQIWAFYSDEDGLPKYYGQINKIETSPVLELHVSWLTCCWLPENTTKWEDEEMLISCGRFKVAKTVEYLSVYSDTSSISHQVHADAVGKSKTYAINPRKGEVWALYRNWSNKIKCSDLKNWEYDIVEILEETDLFIEVLVLEHVSGFGSVFRGKSNEGSSVNLRIPIVNLPVTAVAKPSSYVPLGAHGGVQPFPPAPTAANVNALAGWMVNTNPSSSIQSPALAASSLPGPPNQVSILKHSRTPANTLGMMEYQNNDHEQLMKRLRSAQSVDEVTYPAPPQQASWSLDELPRTVVCTLHQGSTVTSMDFHPSLHSLLAVGCGNGEISLWEVGLRERLISKTFKIKDIAACSVFFQAAIVKDSSISVSRVSWSPDGNLIGVAFTKHLIHLYTYQGPNDLRQNLEIDAHVGGVNDLAFSYPNKQPCIVTCGDDKLIKVWDMTGRKLFNFEGHEAPVYSVCPHQKENIQFIFSTAVDGKIKAWLYDNMGSRVDYDAPGQWCTTMLYSADGSRLFSCGTSKDGDSFLVEWNESEGALKRSYSGFRKKSPGVVQFDTTKNRFLAAGEDNQIKFWDMNNINVLTSTDAEGGLPTLPRLRFNKEGNLLAVTTADGGLKVLADADGMKYLRAIEARSYEASKAPVETKVPGSSVVANINQHISKVERADRSSPAAPLPILNGVDSMARSIEKQRSLDDADKSKTWELAEIIDPVHCRVVTLPDSTDPTNKVVRLLYTNSGTGLLALGAKGIQKLWKWSRNEQNPSGKATASVVPQHWQPNSGLLMTNDVPDNSEEAVPCIALSKNDSYVMSSCGGKISLFNMMTFKVMATFMSPPPPSTFLVFHPKDNNIIAIGMEDATIHFYNVRVDEVKYKLKGHQKRITGLAFSTHLNILVSSSADAQLCFWSVDSWDKKKTLSIQLPPGKAPDGDTRVYFHSDQVRLLVCHESQLAVYDASKMELIRQWVPQDGLSGSISAATYSCNSQLVYAAFTDGNIGVFDADSLRLRCRIASSAYLHQTSSNSQNLYPLVVAAHPQEPNQFAVGLSDGSIKVIEPIESNGKWGVSASVDNGSGRIASPSVTNNSTTEQLQR